MSAQDFALVTGIVIKSEPISEYDRRIVLLTKERGKISAFAKYSRKPGNKLMAPTNPFSFGQFKVHSGRSSYQLSEADISNYFEALRYDFEGAYYGMYFLEICDYYGRENNDETGLLKLLYQSLRALTCEALDKKLVKCIFELKAIMINGEFSFEEYTAGLSQTALYTVDYIMRTPVGKVYSFTVNEEILCELRCFCKQVCARTWDRDFKSLEILENLE